MHRSATRIRTCRMRTIVIGTEVREIVRSDRQSATYGCSRSCAYRGSFILFVSLPNLTLHGSHGIGRAVSRVRQVIAVVLLGLLAPANISWAIALIALSHGPHLVTFEASHDGPGMLLHHHPAPTHDHDHQSEHSHHASEHGDHVVHQAHGDAGVVAKRPSSGDQRSIELVLSHLVVATMEPSAQTHSLLPPATHAASPPTRTIVLRI